VARGVSTLEEELRKLEGAFPGTKLSQQTEKFNEELKKTQQTAKQTAAALRAEAQVLSKQASEMVDGVKQKQIAALKELSNTIGGISKTALLLGGGILGGAFALANKYVQDAEQATDVTRQWESATQSLKESQTQIGAVIAREALPMLKQAAELADRASDFVESNPEVIRAALNTGKILVALGAIGIVASKGIKLVADAKYLLTIPVQLEAARLQDRAATKQLEAAVLRAKDLGVSVPGAGAPAVGGLGGLAGAITSPGGIGALVIGIVAKSIKAADSLKTLNEQIVQLGAKSGASSGLIGTIIATLDSALMVATPLVPAIKNFRQALERDIPLIKNLLGLGGGGGATAGASASFSFGSRGSPAFDQVLKAYEQYKQDDLEAQQKHYDERRKIAANALEAERKANADYAASVARVRSQTTKALADAAEDFAEANARAEQQYQEQRAQIIRDGGQQLEQLEKDIQERLRKNRREHELRVEDLTASRDALGLAKERRRFQEEQAEIRREGSEEIRQRRADLAQRLADLAQSYEQERAQRQADYLARVEEIKASSAEQLAELQKQHVEELRQIQLQKIARIREIDSQFAEERKRRYEYFIRQVRDLDASLLGEKRLREKYQQLMITDLEKFLAAYRAKLSSLGSAVPGRAEGGYAAGLIRTGERGYEYVMSHNTTQAAENMIGGRLTQQGLLAALAGMGGGRSLVWNDVRRFDGSYTNAMREMVRKDTQEILERMLR
jgi:hypothetical protein